MRGRYGEIVSDKRNPINMRYVHGWGRLPAYRPLGCRSSGLFDIDQFGTEPEFALDNEIGPEHALHL
jgi:hypothetical protein